MNKLRNFTAILPVTCNANCVFCPEKEMETKATKAVWLENLIASIKKVSHVIDHVSLSGGEPTLNVKLLQATVDSIRQQTHIQRIGITTNGQFLESANKTLAVLNALTDPTTLDCKLDFMNVSMHSFDADTNMEIMGISSMYDISKLVQFRKILGVRSFHINFVVCEQNIDNIKWEMQQAVELLRDHPHINIVFRVDYNQTKVFKALHAYATQKTGNKVKPKLLKTFDEVFGKFGRVGSKEPEMDYCPSCFTRSLELSSANKAYLKASAYEPNEILKEVTELVFHQDGLAYSDWSRKQPFKLSNFAKPRKESSNVLRDSMERLSRKERGSESGSSGSQCSYGYSGSRCGY